MRKLRHLLFAVTMILAIAPAAAASAVPAPGQKLKQTEKARDPYEDALTDKARTFYLEGARLFKEGEYTGAHAAYQKAWSLKKHYQIAGNMANCEMELGLYPEAANHLAYSLRESARDEPPPEAVKKLFERAKAMVVMLQIRVTEPGARVLIDGALVGTAPLPHPVFVSSGKHAIEARRGTKSAKVEIEMDRGTTRTLELKPEAPHVDHSPPFEGSGRTARVTGPRSADGQTGQVDHASARENPRHNKIVEIIKDRSKRCWEGRVAQPRKLTLLITPRSSGGADVRYANPNEDVNPNNDLPEDVIACIADVARTQQFNSLDVGTINASLLMMSQ